MSQNYLNNTTYPTQNIPYPQSNPNAVSINIFAPQAYGNQATNGCQSVPTNYYPVYGQNMQPNLPLYPQNYNNLINQPNPAQVPVAQQAQAYPNSNNGIYSKATPENNGLNGTNGLNALNETNLINKTNTTNETTAQEAKKEEKKTIIPLTDDYIKSLENYMNNENSKIRLIGAKDVMERFKEDENRKDNPSLIALLNKALRDTSPSVRFLALTTLQLGYSIGNDETVAILKEIQATNKDKIGEDSLLASEILLKLSAGLPQEVAETK